MVSKIRAEGKRLIGRTSGGFSNLMFLYLIRSIFICIYCISYLNYGLYTYFEASRFLTESIKVLLTRTFIMAMYPAMEYFVLEAEEINANKA